MDEEPQVPKIFANRVVDQVIQHMVGDQVKAKPQDFMAIRVTFRHLGGSWEKIVAGDLLSIELLKQVVGAWGQMPHPGNPNELV